MNDKIPLSIRFFLWKFKTVDRLWTLRNLQTCPYHGYSQQSWLTGYCKKCKEIPIVPPVEKMCTFCREEQAILQRASPNGNKEIWSLCWECDKFIDWSIEQSL